jgi:hypothetical protein
MFRRNALFSISLVVALVILQSGCAGTHVGAKSSEDYNKSPLTVAIPTGVSDDVALDAAESAFNRRQWKVVSRSDAEITGALKHRAFDATAIIKIEDRNLVIYSDSIFIDPQTEEQSPGVPYGWLENLRDDMRDTLAYRASQ